jgi:oligopeptidase A
MENFCWEWEVLQSMSAHVDTGAALPRALFDKMLAAKNYQSGMQTLRQVEFSLFDMELHSKTIPAVLETLAAVRAEVAVLPTPTSSRSAHSFSHIFAGGYAAGYYSYKWAELLSADAYAAFEEDASCPPAQNAAVGQRYLQEILQRGGSRSAAENFAAFRGRAPQPDALLRHQGMGQAIAVSKNGNKRNETA